MELGCITTLSLSCKIITALHLFKHLADDLSGSPLKKAVSQMFQSLLSILITSTLYKEVNTGGIISIPIIENTFDNDYIYDMI